MTEHTERETDVLIAGAGPTGLALAIELRRRDVDCLVVEKTDSTVETSRALAIQPRTLQIFEDMGVLDPVLDEGMRVEGATVYHGATELFRLDVDALDPPSPYPFMWWLPQYRTETILLDRLEALGGEVVFECELTGFGQAEESVTATVEHSQGESERTETVTASALVGCDGAHSRVRETLGQPLEGVTTEQELLVADVTLDWDRPQSEGAIWFHEDGVFAALPMVDDLWRLFVDVTPIPAAERPDATPDVLQRLLRTRTDNPNVAVGEATWTSSFVANQRMVRQYRHGQVFLAGDAAHVHNPLGGQGMNLGIQDAANLGWKLAEVLGRSAHDSLLDTYGEERIPAARAVLDETGASGALLVTGNPTVQRLRDTVLPRVIASRRLQSRIFRTVTQLDVDYRESSLSSVQVESPLRSLFDSRSSPLRQARDAWTAPKAGDRAPDGPCSRSSSDVTRLYDELHGPTEWTLLVFAGAAPPDSDPAIDVVQTVDEQAGGIVQSLLVVPHESRLPEEPPAVSVLLDESGELHRQYGADTSAAYLLRPDDHVAFRYAPLRADPILAYLDEQGVAAAAIDQSTRSPS
jgi:2-polyprenyl-6-methoxyphenol hydroxylase-like FAD-dependent oxidoreductase